MIIGFADQVRLPRCEKIRLGVKLTGKKKCWSCKGSGEHSGRPCRRCYGTGKSQFPRETDFFVLPYERVAAKDADPDLKEAFFGESVRLTTEGERIAKVFGKTPRELTVMIPLEDKELFFSQALKRWTATGLKCRSIHQPGNQRALSLADDGSGFEEIDCPYQKCDYYQNGECGENINLMILLPDVGIQHGVYQIDTGSYHSTLDLETDIRYIRDVVVQIKAGRPWISMIPLTLWREPKETHALGKTQIHYCMRLRIEDDVLENLTPKSLPKAPRQYRLQRGDPLDIEEDINPAVVSELVLELKRKRDAGKAGEVAPSAAPTSQAAIDQIWAKIEETYKEVPGSDPSLPVWMKMKARYENHPEILLDYLGEVLAWHKNGNPTDQVPHQPKTPEEESRKVAPAFPPEEKAPAPFPEDDEEPPAAGAAARRSPEGGGGGEPEETKKAEEDEPSLL